jgi:hypothetical protein
VLKQIKTVFADHTAKELIEAVKNGAQDVSCINVVCQARVCFCLRAFADSKEGVAALEQVRRFATALQFLVKEANGERCCLLLSRR